MFSRMPHSRVREGPMSLTRRDVLALGGLPLAGATLAPPRLAAQTPKRGGTLTIRAWDPPLFDPMLTTAYRVHVAISFTHSRLVKHKAGPSIAPGTFPIEGDLAESWTQPNDTTYVFKLRRGVRWHPKPPVNGRELTSADVKYSIERFLTVKGNPSAYMLRAIDRVEAPDAYTVRIVLKEPNVWFLEMLANPMTCAIVAREAVEKFGDLKKAETVVGTGPWMLESHRPNQGLTFVRHPRYFQPGLPYIDRVEMAIDEDNASRISSFLAGKYDLGYEFPGAIGRTDWIQIKDTVKQRRPTLRTAEFVSNVELHISMRTDQKPFNDVRVRQAISLAVNRQGIIDQIAEGVGVFNPAIPAAFKDWALPIDQLGEGAKYFKHDRAEARRLLAAAGYPNGFPASLCYATYGSTAIMDTVQLLAKDLKEVGIDTKIDQREYGAFIATCYFGKFDSMTYGPQTPFLDPDNFVYGMHYPGEMKNQSYVDDPAVTDLLVRQRRTPDLVRRREVLAELQRYLAKQQYYVQVPSGVNIAVWENALKNYGPNLGYDYGGRLTAAWLDR
ncbi:MAG: ABC transporter substrate-binding protein [Candidatus Rokubacteria bacterium]|nr:ABC transporter substrate-binding protein [Candidatus Rokubacteria bacterium]